MYTYYHTIKKNGITTILQNLQHVGDGLFKIDVKSISESKINKSENNIENGVVYYNPLLLFSPCRETV